MAWKDYKVTTGDTVSTPYGEGKIRRISEAQQSAHVDIDGQLFDVPLVDMTKIDATAAPAAASDEPSAEPMAEGGEFGEPADPGDLQPGDKVQKVDKPSSTGKVTAVTQRTIRGKWDANGKTFSYPKREAGQHIQKQEGEPDKQDEPQDEQEEQPNQQQQEQSRANDTAENLYGILELQKHMEQIIDEKVEGELKDIKDIANQKAKRLEVTIDGKTATVSGLRHRQLEQLITYSALRMNALLVGMAGTGKTHAAAQAAEALGLPFYSMSVGAQTSKSDIIGYMSAGGDYVATHFRQAYEFGGIFLMDEIDAGNANVLIQVNAALSNGLCAFPDKMVEQHPDFVFIASANTYGNGANRQYVGRNQLDAATLDRFAIIDWLIDDDLESSLTVGLNGKAWYMAVRAARDYVAEKNIRALISPRATQKGSKLLDVGQSLDEVIDATMLASVPEDKRPDVKQVAVTIFEKFASQVPSTLDTSVNPPSVQDLIA